VDDDVIYGSSVVTDLVKMFDKFNGTHCITNVGQWLTDTYEIYSGWNRFLSFWLGQRYVDIIQGFSSFITTPKQLPHQIFNYEGAPHVAKFVDDMWISGWLHYNNIPIYQMARTPTNMPIFNFCLEWSSTCLGQTANKGFVNEPIVAKWLHATHNVKFHSKKLT
jgi:hypothetical protein